MAKQSNQGAKARWKDCLKKVGKVYHYRYWDGIRIRHGSTRCEELRDAKIWLKRFRAANDGVTVGIRGIPTLEAMLSRWDTAVREVVSEKAREITLAQIRKHFAAQIALPIHKLNHEVVQGVVNHYLASNGCTIAKNGRKIARPHTAGGAIALIRRLDTIMNYAVRLKFLPEIPYFVKLTEALEKDGPILSGQQIPDFVRVIDEAENPHVHMAVRLMLGLGIREGEALACRWEWFHFDTGLYVGHGKSKRAQPIPIPDWLLDWLLAWPGRVQSGLVMPSERDQVRGNPQPHFAQFTTKAVRRAGLAVGVAGLSPHCLRATFASIHDGEAGSSLAETQALMNHSPGSPVTRKHYIRRNVSRLKVRQEAAAVVMGMSKPPQVDAGTGDFASVVRICNNTFQTAYK
jgi:integrase